MRYETSFTLRADPATAFDYLAYGGNALSLHPTGTTMEQVPPGSIGLGTEYRFTSPGRPGFRSSIAEYDRPHRLAFESAFDGQSPTRATWTLTPAGPGTFLSVETTTSFLGPNWVKPFIGLLTLGAWPLLLVKMWQLKRRISRDLDRASDLTLD